MFSEIAGLHSIANVLLKIASVNMCYSFNLLFFQVKCTCSTSQNKCSAAAAPIIIKCWKAFSCWYRISQKGTPCFSYAGLILANARVGVSKQNKEIRFWKWTELWESKSRYYCDPNIKDSWQSNSSKSIFSSGFDSIMHCILQPPKWKFFHSSCSAVAQCTIKDTLHICGF